MGDGAEADCSYLAGRVFEWRYRRETHAKYSFIVP
jgi:hypothetical protein